MLVIDSGQAEWHFTKQKMGLLYMRCHTMPNLMTAGRAYLQAA